MVIYVFNCAFGLVWQFIKLASIVCLLHESQHSCSVMLLWVSITVYMIGLLILILELSLVPATWKRFLLYIDRLLLIFFPRIFLNYVVVFWVLKCCFVGSYTSVNTKFQNPVFEYFVNSFMEFSDFGVNGDYFKNTKELYQCVDQDLEHCSQLSEDIDSSSHDRFTKLNHILILINDRIREG